MTVSKITNFKQKKLIVLSIKMHIKTLKDELQVSTTQEYSYYLADRKKELEHLLTEIDKGGVL